MTLHLFDEKDREPMWSGRRNETRYSFYDRSGHPDSERVRNMLERWASRYPDSKRKDIISRIRSKDMDSFDNAFFEMFLHEFLSGTGASVTLEPEIGGKNPDFALSDHGFDYVVEATRLDFEQRDELKQSRNEDLALDWLDMIDAPRFGLWVETDGVLEPMIPKKKLLQPSEKLIEDTDYEHLAELPVDESIEKAPYATVTHGDWTITGRLLPLGDEGHGSFIAIGPSKGGAPDDIGMIRKVLRRKAKQCAGAEKVIIAIEIDGIAGYRACDALFGTQTMRIHFIRETGKSVGTSPGKVKKDGFWFDQYGPQHKHVVGVVFFNPVRPWSVKRATALFVPNPYVETQLPKWSQEIDHVDFTKGKWEQAPGKPIVDFMQDYEDVLWPGAY